MKIAVRSFLLLLLFFNLHSYAQVIPTWYDGFRDNYYYKLNDKQAFDIFSHPDKPIDTGLFAKPFYVSPYSADSLILPQGNYLEVNLRNEKLEYKYVPITHWRMYFIDGYHNLSVQLLDVKTNKPIVVTSVRCNKRKMVYDEKTKTYLLKSHPSDGVVSVTDKNETFYFYFNENKDYKNTYSSQQKINRFLYKDPLKYGTILYQFYTRSAMDAVRALNFKHNEINCYRLIKGTGFQIWNRIANIGKRSRYLNSYFYFSKPKYRTEDTIRFKAHLLKDYKKGIWYDKPVLVFLDERDENIFLGKAYSRRKGAGYDFQFVIADSMNIDLDDDYEITLKDLDSNRLASGRFTYEEYELKKAVFSIDLPQEKKQYKGKPFGVHFTAKDENGLPMPDTRASITIVSNKVNYVKPDALFVPDTIWNYSFMIKNGEDKIVIPDTVFPEASMKYTLNVVMQNSENERTAINEQIDYALSGRSLKMNLVNDSIYITNTEMDTQEVRVYAEDRFEYRLVDTFVKTPCALPLNAHAEAYYCENDESDEELYLSRSLADVSVNPLRTKDSVFFTLDNPHKLPVVYHLLESGKEIKKGTQQDFPFALAAKEKSYYYLKTEYVWAGMTAGKNIFVPTFKNTIKLNVEQPAVITPGKEAEISITATDFKGHPVQNLNLLSYAYTRKFGEDKIPELPFLNYVSESDKDRSDFEWKDKDNNHDILLDYPFWNAKLMLDTDWTYRFRYPSVNKIEYTIIPVADSITQVAPFVMDNGAPQAIQYVYIDHVPVYLGFTDKRMAYSFEVDTNYHNVQIRTSKKLIEIDSLKVKPFVKTLFSIDQNRPDSTFSTVSMPDSFTREERRNLLMYVMKIKMSDADLKYAYLERKEDECQFFDLSGGSRTYHGKDEITVGPVYWRYWNFKSYHHFVRSFEYEPGYTYSFNESLVKMKSNESIDLVPNHGTSQVPYIFDTVITKEHLLKEYEAMDYSERRNSAPKIIENKENAGSCNLTIDYNNLKTGLNPVNILLCRTDDFNFINIYAGTTTTFRQLKPGQYRIIFVAQYNLYLQSGIVDVKENGSNFYRIVKTDTLRGINESLVNQALQNLYQPDKLNKDADVGTLINEMLKANYNGKLNTYSGIVLDGEDGNEPLIGASIKIQGTTIGTQADMDGNFEIAIPDSIDNGMIEVSYIGYAPQVFRAGKNMKITLKGDRNVLYEVLITTPYGPPVTKENFTGAADVVTARKITLTPVSDIIYAIEGAAPGIEVVKGNGAPGSGASIQIRGRGSLSAAVTPLIVLNGAPFDGDITELDPSVIASVNVLKDAMATGLYGSRGANGVIIITTKQGAVLPEHIMKGLQKLPVPDEMMVSSLRSNFRDDAYWQPDLVTDKDGKATFKVTFPDDITNWKTIVIGMGDKKHTGYAFGNIKSYKPVAASLYLPHFLLDGDSALLIGKSVNYIPDTIPATTTFFQNDLLKKKNKIQLGSFYNDTLLLTGKGADSIKLKYLLTKEDGYFDGEEKTIPLQRVGVKTAAGSFMPLDEKDTSFTIYPVVKGDTLHLSATASLIDILLDEIDVVRNYGYMCNEQKASKILAFLAKQKLYASLQKTFDAEDRKYVQGLIDKILKSRNKDQLWGWWDEGTTIPWISNHVLKTLLEAKAMGYNCNIDTKAITDTYVFNMERDTVYTDFPTLQLLAECGVTLNYEKYISRLERNKDLNLNTAFELILLRQKLQLPYKPDKLLAFKESDIFGNIYWKDTARYVYNNEVLTTLNALKILQKDSSTGIPVQKIVNWLIQQRSVSGWRNTYESANIIEVLAANIPLGNKDALRPALQFSGAIDEKAEQFPYKRDILPGSALRVQKSGYAPVYFSWYYNKWDTANTILGNNFKLQSRFEVAGKSISTLPAGVPVTMKVNIRVEKSAEFVMIEIPIPAGCSYQSKGQFYSNYEIHREYFEDHVSVFCEKLPKGNYEYQIQLLPRYKGSYTLNPAKAELMYFPVFYGRERIKRVEIKE